MTTHPLFDLLHTASKGFSEDLGLGFGWVAFYLPFACFCALSRLWVLVLSFTFPPFLSGLVLFLN